MVVNADTDSSVVVTKICVTHKRICERVRNLSTKKDKSAVIDRYVKEASATFD